MTLLIKWISPVRNWRWLLAYYCYWVGWYPMSSMSTDASFTSISYLSCKIVFFGSILSLFFCWSIFSVSEWGNHSGPPTFSWALRAKKSNFWNGHRRGAISFIRGSMWSPEIPTPLEHFFWVKIYCPKKQRFWSLSVLRSIWRGAQFRLLPICMSNPTDPFVSGGFRHLKNIQKPLARWLNIAILLSSSIYKY